MRLIDADELRDHWLYDTVGNEYEYCPNDVLYSIDCQPTVDAVQVVRCKDCKYHSWGKYCKLTGDPEDIWNDDDFCSFGERKEK